MKKYLFIAALALMAIACQKEEPKVTPSITLSSQQEVTIPTDGAIETVSFNANVAWTASIDNSAWQLSAKSGDKGDASIKVTAPQNTTNDAVVATLTIKAETATQTVKFTQLQKDALIVTETEKEVDASEQDFYIDVKANISYEAEVASDCDWIAVSTPITKSMVDYQTHVHVDANNGEAREGTIIFKAEGVAPVEYTVKQAAFEPFITITGPDEFGYLYVGKEGGTVSFQVETNVGEYVIKDYSTGDYYWQHGTLADGVVTVTLDANTDYVSRESYIKVTFSEYIVPEIDPETGEPTGEMIPYAERIYILQDGVAEQVMGISMPSEMEDAPDPSTEKNKYSLAVTGDFMIVSTGLSVHVLNASDASYIQKVELADGITINSLTSDDEGNVVIAVGGGYDSDLTIMRIKKGDMTFTPEVLVSWVNSVYGNGLASLRVNGDVYGDAVVSMFQAGVIDYGGVSYGAYWKIENGSANWSKSPSDIDWAVPEQVGMPFLDDHNVWNSVNCVFYPFGNSPEAGFIYNGYDDTDYSVRFYDTESGEWSVVMPALNDWASGTLSCDMIDWNGKKVIGFLSMSFFPAWSCPSFLTLFDVTDAANPSLITMYSYTCPGTPWGVDYVYSTADFVLGVEDSALVAYIVDGMQRTIIKEKFPAK